MEKLKAQEVLAIREKLGLSREQLAEKLDVSADSVKAWEDDAGSKKDKLCGGPVRLLLMLLERSPNLLEMLNDPPMGLPRHDALPDSGEWFRLQRLLAILDGCLGEGIDYWSSVYVEEKLNEEWLWDMEQANLLQRDSGNLDIRYTTLIADKKFHLGAWRKWVKENNWENTEDFLVMTPAELARLR